LKIVKHSNVPFGEPTDSQLTSLTLLARVRAGDEAGWERLVRLYGPLVYSWCRRAGLTPEDAGDVSQEVFATLSTKLDLFQRERPGDSFRRWLKTVTNNRARDLHRRHKDRPRARGGTAAQLEMAAQPDFAHFELLDESDAERGEESNQLLRGATELVRADFEPNTWAAFWQTVVEGRAAADVAADLGISANAVRVSKSRVRARLREEMSGLLDEPTD
jgi:RNA polymerase sigma-70 factor (ECF subfamily)